MTANMKNYASLVSFIGKIFGSLAQATLFGVDGNHITPIASTDFFASESDEIEQFILTALNNPRIRKRGGIANYMMPTEFSTIVKISLFFIKNEADEIEGVLCISMPCDSLVHIQTLLAGLIQNNNETIEPELPETEEETPVSDREISLNTIGEYVREFGVEPGRVSQDERMEIICDLYDMGIYNLKGAVARTAEELEISEQSVYRYLTKIKKARS